MANPSIYDQLAKEPLSDLTVTQLNSGSSVTAIDQATINYWKGPITLARIVQSSRTYAHGLPIPNESGVEILVLADGATGFFQPPGSEVWLVQALRSDETISISYTDGVSFVLTNTGTALSPEHPKYLTNSLYYAIANGSGSEATVNLAVHKVSL
jgi:hypothetical protein